MGKTVQLALAGAAAVAVAFGFARYGYGLFVPTFREEFGLSTEAVGLVSSAGYATYLPAMAATGFLSGRVGPRVPVVAGALCAGAGMLLIAAARGPVPLVAGVLLAGTSPALCVAPFADATAMLVGEGRRDRVLSVVSTGTTFGLVAAGPVVVLTAVGRSPTAVRVGDTPGPRSPRPPSSWPSGTRGCCRASRTAGRAPAAPGAGRASAPGGSCAVDRPPCWGRRSPTA